MRYERPAIEERAAVGGPLIKTVTTSVPTSPAWRRAAEDTDEAR